MTLHGDESVNPFFSYEYHPVSVNLPVVELKNQLFQSRQFWPLCRRYFVSVSQFEREEL